MEKRFAILDYANSIEDINVKFNLLKRTPAFMLEWYINKFNPYKMREINIEEAVGFEVKLPIIKEDIFTKKDELLILTEKTLNDLINYDVEIILPPKRFPFDFPDIIRIADGKSIFPFFIMEMILKALKYSGKNIKNAEILIIDGNEDYVLTLINMIYENTNNLAIMTEQTDNIKYINIAEDIFNDNGLNIIISGKNKGLLENADVIINTSSKEDRYDFYYKRGAIYFELSRNNSKFIELIGKRSDLLTANNLKLEFDGKKMHLDMFEAFFYTKSRQYRNFLNRGYSDSVISNIKNSIDGLNLKPSLLTLINP